MKLPITEGQAFYGMMALFLIVEAWIFFEWWNAIEHDNTDRCAKLEVAFGAETAQLIEPDCHLYFED